MEYHIYCELGCCFIPTEKLNDPDYRPEGWNRRQAAEYTSLIQKAIKEDLRKLYDDVPGTGGKALACDISHKDLETKVQRIEPTVEIWQGGLVGRADISVTEALTQEEKSFLLDYMVEQYLDGWGEDFFHRGFQIPGGKLRLGFCLYGAIKFGEEFKADRPVRDPEPPIPGKPDMMR